MISFWSVVTRPVTSLQKVQLRTMKTYDTHNQDGSDTNSTPIEGEAPRERDSVNGGTCTRLVSDEDTMSTETLHTDSGIDNEHDDYVRTAYPFLVFAENDKYGLPTGSAYYRCIECEREIPTGTAKDCGFSHDAGCPHHDNNSVRVEQ